jgi:hypothetical protein
MTNKQFTEEQIAILEDKVINKIMGALIALQMLTEGRKVEMSFLCHACEGLNELIKWVRDLRK